MAEAQARALVDLLASFAAHGPGQRSREILLAVDEFSAVARRLPIWQLYERARSLGLAVQVSAQSWPGLAAPRTSGTGSPPPPTAASGCCAPRTPSRWPRWPASGKLIDTSPAAARRSRAVGREGSSPGRGGPRWPTRRMIRGAGRRPGGLHLPRRRDLHPGKAPHRQPARPAASHRERPADRGTRDRRSSRGRDANPAAHRPTRLGHPGSWPGLAPPLGPACQAQSAVRRATASRPGWTTSAVSERPSPPIRAGASSGRPAPTRPDRLPGRRLRT